MCPTNTGKHPGDAQNTYTQKRRTPQEMEEARKQQAEELEKKDADHLALLKKIAKLEQQLDDNEKFSATPWATIPMARPLRRTETYIEIPSKADKGGNAMEIDESGTEFEEFVLRPFIFFVLSYLVRIIVLYLYSTSILYYRHLPLTGHFRTYPRLPRSRYLAA